MDVNNDQIPFCRINIGLENWMILPQSLGGLGLNQSQSIVYARIFDVTYTGDGVFRMYQSDFTKLYGISRSSFFKALTYLIDNNLVIEQKNSNLQNSVRCFVINYEPVKKFIEIPVANTDVEFSTIEDEPQYIDVENLDMASKVRSTHSQVRSTHSQVRSTHSQVRSTHSQIESGIGSTGKTMNGFTTQTINSSCQNSLSTCTNEKTTSSSCNSVSINRYSQVRSTPFTCENTNNEASTCNDDTINNININKIKFNSISEECSILDDIENSHDFNALVDEIIRARNTKECYNDQIPNALWVQTKRLQKLGFQKPAHLLVEAFKQLVAEHKKRGISAPYQLRWLKDNEAIDAMFKTLGESDPRFKPTEKDLINAQKQFFCDRGRWYVHCNGKTCPLVFNDLQFVPADYPNSKLNQIFSRMIDTFNTTDVAVLAQKIGEAQSKDITYPHVLPGLKGRWMVQYDEDHAFPVDLIIDGEPVRMATATQEEALELAKQMVKVGI